MNWDSYLSFRTIHSSVLTQKRQFHEIRKKKHFFFREIESDLTPIIFFILFSFFRRIASHHQIETLGPLRSSGGEIRMGLRDCPKLRWLVVAHVSLWHSWTSYSRRVPCAPFSSRCMTSNRGPWWGQLRTLWGPPMCHRYEIIWWRALKIYVQFILINTG